MSRRPEDEPGVQDVQRELRRVLRGLRRRGPIFAGLAENFRKGRLGPRHALALAVVAREEPLTVGDLAKQLGLSLPNASQVASDLNMADLVQRTEDQIDRRRTIVTLHEHRRHHVRDWLDERARPIAAALDRLDPADREGLVRGLAALADELEAAAPDRCRD
jgi:DNA-binding MarR family transcriptional regulator